MHRLRLSSRRGAALSAALLLAGLGAPATQAATTRPTTHRTTHSRAAAMRSVHVVGHWPKQTISGHQALTVRFSAAVTLTEAPRISPSPPGKWQATGARTLRFVPRADWAPYTTVQLTTRSGPHIRVTGAAHLTVQARPAPGELLQDLITLHYLPVRRTRQGKLVLDNGWPTQLNTIWQSDRAEMVRGAVMAFESQHGLDIDGVAGPAAWPVLDTALADTTDNTAGYTYALGDQTEPETLTVWHDGHVVVHAPANTGISDSPTEPGTFAVYERLRSQVMTGTNPDGTPYSDPVQWVAYFNGGDAVHYIARADYGVPQSLGCIETSYATAEQAWGYLTYGSLVTVTPES
jgi:hypothetical protein